MAIHCKYHWPCGPKLLIKISSVMVNYLEPFCFAVPGGSHSRSPRRSHAHKWTWRRGGITVRMWHPGLHLELSPARLELLVRGTSTAIHLVWASLTSITYRWQHMRPFVAVHCLYRCVTVGESPKGAARNKSQREDWIRDWTEGRVSVGARMFTMCLLLPSLVKIVEICFSLQYREGFREERNGWLQS